MDGVISVVHDGNFVGVVTESEHALFAAMERVERLVEWDFGDPGEIRLRRWTISAKREACPSQFAKILKIVIAIGNTGPLSQSH